MPRNFHNWYNTLFIFLSLQTVWSSRNNVIFSVSFYFPLYFNSSSQAFLATRTAVQNSPGCLKYYLKPPQQSLHASLEIRFRREVIVDVSLALPLCCFSVYSNAGDFTPERTRGWSVSITFPLMCAVFCSSKLPHVKCAFKHMHCLLLGFSAKHHIFCYIEKIALDY